MRAARIHGWNLPPRIDTVDRPVPVAGESLVRMQAATVSHLDITVAGGDFDLVPPLPYVPGCEGAGTVVASDSLAPGTQVILRDGTVGLDRDGTWQEYLSVPDGALLALPTPLPPALAATFLVPVSTAYVALHDVGGLRPGQRVAITGANGAVGAMAVQLAARAEADVVAVVSRRERLATLPAGVRGVSLDDPGALADLDRERPFDLLVDTIGGDGLGRRIGWVAAGGSAVCLGYTAGTGVALDLPGWFFADVTLRPVNLMRHEARAETVALALLPEIADGSLRVAVEEFPLDRAAEAYARAQSGDARFRVVLTTGASAT
jgi:NADPH:quinone reductase